MNWLGNKLSTKCAKYFPDLCATSNAGLNGLSLNLSYSVVLVNIRSPTDLAIKPNNSVMVSLSQSSP